MHRRQKQPVCRENPQKQHAQQHKRESSDFARRDREDISDQVAIEFCEAVSAERRDENAERDRAIKYAEKFNEKGIHDAVLKNFGVEMNVPKGYALAANEPDFLWARYEYPTASQGFFIYSYPYEGKESLSPGALLAARNKFAARIPGPSDGSYMTTSDAFAPDFRMFRMEGRLWCEMRGFWDVHGDFMGGPFVSYTTVDTATNRVFTLDCYIYSPKNPKRNYMRGVEHLLYLVKFPAAEAPQEEQRQ